MTLLKKQGHRIILVLILAALILKSYFSEKLLANAGFGWDGVTYASLTHSFDYLLEHHQINPYYFQRIGIPFVLYHFFSFCKIAFTDVNILKAYSFVNIGFIAIAVLFFFSISKALNISRNVEILCFSLLFFCFPILKYALFYPIIMDIPAFSIAMVLVYLYVKQKTILFFIGILLGSFVYPNFIILGSLFFFKLPSLDQEETPVPENGHRNKLKLVISSHVLFYVLFCFTLPIVYIYFFKVAEKMDPTDIFPRVFDSKTLNSVLYWVCFSAALLYLIFLNNFPLKYFSFKKVLKSVNIPGVILTVLVFIAVQQLVARFASHEEGYLTTNKYMFNLIKQSLKNPLNYIVAHVFYYGIAPLLCLFIIKDFKKEIMNLGFGVVLFFNLIVYFSLGSESRQLINYYPFLVLLIMLVLDKKWNISLGFSVICSGLCLALSHFWFTINKGLSAELYGKIELMDKFPAQRYFMFQGPWVNNYMYLVHLGVCLFIIALLWVCLKIGLIERKKTVIQ